MNWFTIFFIVFLGFAVVQRLVETFIPRQIVPGKRTIRWSLGAMVLLHAMLVGSTVAEFFLFSRSVSPVVWAAAVGLVLYCLSVLLRNAAIRALGRYWSLHVEVRLEHVLVTDGVYSWVRHPAYLAIWVEVISVPLAVNCFVTAVMGAVVYIVFLLYRISVEEAALVTELGDRYRAYQRTVPAFLPWRWSGLTGQTQP